MANNQSSLEVFLLASVLLLSGCASSPNSFPQGCENTGSRPPAGYVVATCFFSISALQPPPIDHPVLRLAVIPMSVNDARGLPESLREEINSEMETDIHNLKRSFPRFEIVERTRIDAAIKELEFQGSGLVRDDNFVGVGRMLGADHVMIFQVITDGDIETLQKSGGYTRVITSGKLIRVQAGTVVFQQSVRQESFVIRPSKGTWLATDMKNHKRRSALRAAYGLHFSLREALIHSPVGIAWGDEPDGNRAWVRFILSHGPADNAGIQHGDIITAIEGIPVHSPADKVLEDLEMIPRELVHISVERNGREQTFAVRPLKRNNTEMPSSPAKP